MIRARNMKLAAHLRDIMAQLEAARDELNDTNRAPLAREFIRLAGVDVRTAIEKLGEGR